MRRALLILSVAGLLLAACSDEPTVGGTGTTGATGETTATGATGATAEQTAASCMEATQDTLLEPGVLTVGTGNPAFPPWWEGGQSQGSEFEINDPANGEGYEGAVVAEVATRLGFAFPDEVRFVPVAFNQSFAPGDKDFDLVLQQISYRERRDQAVDFSDSYYEVNQALVSTQGSPIAGATTVAELADATLGAPIGTTSLEVIETVIQPSPEPAVYDDLAGAVQDLENGSIDGIVVDLPTAFFITAVQIDGGVVVGQFPTEGEQEYFAMAFETGSPLVGCVNLALAEMKADGTIDAIHQEWLADKTNAPVLS